MTRIPTTLFTGFLGSGKTTIISHLVEGLQKSNEQVVYIKNEIGDVDIDTQLIQGQHIKTKQLLNGCICCTLTGPFIHAINEIVEDLKPTRILIEASGTADVAALALMISSHEKLFRDGVLTIIDVVNFDGFKDLSITAENQTRFTDIVVFNKVELVDIDRKSAVVGYVRELNTHSPIIESPLGKLSPQVVFGISSIQLDEMLDEHVVDNDHHSDLHNHEEVDQIEGFHIPLRKAVNIQLLQNILSTLPEYVFRVKGIVFDEKNNPFVVQKVASRTDIQPLSVSKDLKSGFILLVGFQILQFKNALTADILHKLRHAKFSKKV